MIPLVAPTFFDQLPKWLGPITHSESRRPE
jgi:hypothetical protein